ncbi:MAG: hypothetical protein EOO06_08860 [Chitinophagaceae bacterium]|nr:MAG: hypothetical protein EOO06_08860 [Chitinophagaceae bacterium]
MATKKKSATSPGEKSTLIKIAETIGTVAGEIAVKKDRLVNMATGAVESVKTSIQNLTGGMTENKKKAPVKKAANRKAVPAKKSASKAAATTKSPVKKAAAKKATPKKTGPKAAPTPSTVKPVRKTSTTQVKKSATAVKKKAAAPVKKAAAAAQASKKATRKK